MATDTSKITSAADDLSDKLTKGGSAAKTLGVEIANTFNALDARITALEAGGGTQPPIQPPTSGATGGKITEFTTSPGGHLKVDNYSYGVDTAGKSHSMTKLDDYTLRFEVRTGENWAQYDSSSVNRSELDGYSYIIPPALVKVHYKFKLEPGGNNTASWFVIGQMHNDDKGRAAKLGLSNIEWTSPPFAIELYGEKLSVMLRHCRTDQDPQNHAGNLTLVRAWTDSKAIVRGKMYDIRMEARSVNDSSGYLKLWLDGALVCDYHGPLGYGPWGVYWCYGLYREANTTTIAAVYQNMTLT